MTVSYENLKQVYSSGKLRWWGVDTSTAFESIRENIKFSAEESLGYYKLKHHKPLLIEGY
jgi:hypothetical protein